jgi:ankyrin repeat protein
LFKTKCPTYAALSKDLMSWNKELAKKQCNNGSTPLHQHLCRSDVMVPILLEANLSAAYQPNKSGSFPIHTAASNGQLNGVVSLIKMCPQCVNLCDTMGRTFLHVAVENKCYDIVLYACGTPSIASILNTRDNAGNTMLHLAVLAGDLRMVCALLRQLQVQLSISNNNGETPRDLAWSGIPDHMYFVWVMSCYHYHSRQNVWFLCFMPVYILQFSLMLLFLHFV